MLDLEYGEVRMGASDMTLQFYLLPYLEQFHQLYPEIKVTVTNAPTPQTMEHLRLGRIDFGVVTNPIEEDPGLDIHCVRKVRDIFVGGNKFYNLKDQVLSYSTLQELPLICLEGNTSTRKYVDSFLRKNEVVITPEFELATSDMIVQFAMRNLGIGCVVEDFASRQLADQKLFRLTFQDSIPEREICLIFDRRTTMSVAAQKLKELLLQK